MTVPRRSVCITAASRRLEFAIGHLEMCGFVQRPAAGLYPARDLFQKFVPGHQRWSHQSVARGGVAEQCRRAFIIVEARWTSEVRTEKLRGLSHGEGFRSRDVEDARR